MPFPKTSHQLAPLVVLAAASLTAAIDDAERAADWNNRAAVLADQERFLEAETGYRFAIRILESAYGHDAEQLAVPLNNLAIVYRRLGRLKDAESSYQRSLEIHTQARGSMHPSAMLVRINLGRLYQQMRRYQQAEELIRSAIADVSPARDPALAAAAHHTLAVLLLSKDHINESLCRTDQAIELWRAAAKTGDTAKALAMRAEILRRARRYPEAADAFDIALSAARSALGPSHPEVGRILSAYSRTLAKLGERPRAKKLRAQAQALLAAAPDRAARAHIVDVPALVE